MLDKTIFSTLYYDSLCAKQAIRSNWMSSEFVYFFLSQLLLFIERELIFEWILFNIVSEELSLTPLVQPINHILQYF